MFGPDQLLEGNARYKKIRDINRGSYGLVVLAIDLQTADQVALKFIPRGEHITKYVEREIVNHMKLHHPHVIALREVFLTPTHLVLAMEFAAGGDLYRYVMLRQGLPEDTARWFFQQLIVAVDYCHRVGVTSRDIKLENTLLSDGARPLIKLADFGFSKDANDQSAPTSRVGTPSYLAPEVVSNQPGKAYDGPKADIWSCGVLLFGMATNLLPFSRSGDELLQPNQRQNQVLQRILRSDFAFPTEPELSLELRDLIGRMLVRDPAHRASIQEIEKHPWFLHGLNPASLRYNDTLLKESLAHQPPAALLDQVRHIVEEARRDGQGGSSQQRGHAANAGGLTEEEAAHKHSRTLDSMDDGLACFEGEDEGDSWDW